jgi:putative NIF3 family GTP cyclohydrolase 1 type 2
MQTRRDFIINTARAGAAMTVFSSAPLSVHTAGAYTVQDIIDMVLKEIPGAPFKETVDTLKSGDAGNKVSGIVTTMFATVDVIEAAVKQRANFIIAHEPTFYNHTDSLEWTADNQIVKKKLALLQQHNIAVWRCHDYWHACRPDGILYGVLKKAGWLDFNKEVNPAFTIPATKLSSIVNQLKKNLEISHVKVVGDLQQSCSKIALLPGAWGGQRQVAMVEKENPDLLIIGETHEWETVEYIRDRRKTGSPTALIILGHSVSEEPGMEWMAEWLQKKFPDLGVKHVASKDPFTWV